MARGAIPLSHAYVLFAAQLGAYLAMLQVGGIETLETALPMMALALLYPFAKRVTSYAQIFLGVTLAWAIFVGVAFQGTLASIVAYGHMPTIVSLVCLVLAYVIWMVIFDTVYASLDMADDAKAGVKSMAIRFQRCFRVLLQLLALGQIILSALGGWFLSMSWAYYIAVCGCNGLVLAFLLWDIDIGHPYQNAWWFEYGAIAFCSTTTAGLAL